MDASVWIANFQKLARNVEDIGYLHRENGFSKQKWRVTPKSVTGICISDRQQILCTVYL